MKRRCVDLEDNSGNNRAMSSNVVQTGRNTRRNLELPLIMRFLLRYKFLVFFVLVGLVIQLVLAIFLTFSTHFSDEPQNSMNILVNQDIFMTVESREKLFDSKIQETSDNPTNVTLPTLNVSSLGFLPKCNITTKEAISAIQRAKTRRCKEQLADVACKIASKSMYLERLPRMCYNNETTYGTYVGCFKDDKIKRILPDYFAILKETNSPRNCVDLCLQSGFQYAGVQYGVECFCGNTKPSVRHRISHRECNMKCPIPSFPTLSTNSDLWEAKFCGGYFTMNIFETGFSTDQNGKTAITGLETYDNNLTMRSTSRVVFFLTLNGRALRQVLRLIKALFHENHYFYIHVDSRQDYLFRELLILRQKLPNHIRFMSNRLGTIWGGASLLTVLLRGMEDLITLEEEWNWKWDYVINLSECDFPLKTTRQLEYFLTHNKGKNFLKSHGRDVQKFIQKQGLDKTFDECEFRMWRVGDRKLPAGIFIDGGSDWIALHRDFVSYIVKSQDELVAGLINVFKQTLLPAESFFHTLLRNSGLCQTFVDNNLHVTNWKRKLGCKCQYKNIVDWCGCSPNDFRDSDWSRLQMTESRLLFFGRKFEAIVSQGIINQLESWLYPERYLSNYPTLDRFWLSLYHHHDISPSPDDALVTLGRSLSRIATQAFLTKVGCPLVDEFNFQIELNEITAYKHSDAFQGILVNFNSNFVSHQNQEFSLSVETWVKPFVKVTKAARNPRTSKLQDQIQDIRIGGDYEQKEQIFRNFASALGPFSAPILAYTGHSSESFNISVVWIDPSDIVTAIVNSSLSEGATASFVKPNLRQPLKPGVWTVKIFNMDHDLLYRVEFAILPLEIFQENLIDSYDDMWVNSFYLTENNTFSSLELRGNIDDLVSKFFTLQDFCLQDQQNFVTLAKWKRGSNVNGVPHLDERSLENPPDAVDHVDTSLCSHTQWSSFYPDPKSSINGIDPRTGLLVP